MYCSHCGAKASGNYCAGCGTELTARIADLESPASPAARPMGTQVVECGDWSEIVDYDVLLRMPAVRNLIASHAARSHAKMTGEQFLGLCDKFLSPLTAGVPLSPLAKVGQSMYAKMGVKTGKTRTEVIPAPAGQVLVSAICSLAERGQELLTATPAAEGCLLEASLPSDFLSFAGKLMITVARVPLGTQVEAMTNIPGQLFDWGKSSRSLGVLFQDLQQQARAA